MRSGWTRWLAWRLAAPLLLVAASATDAAATHFRYATFQWDPNPAIPNRISFRIDTSWRWSYPFPTGARPAVGATITVPNAAFDFGDGSAPVGALVAVVTSVNPGEDWLTATTLLTHDYPAVSATYTASLTGCCRVSSLRGGNADRPFIVSTGVTVDFADPNHPPVSSTLPLIRVPHNVAAAQFTIPATDPDGDPIRFAIATAAESGLATPAPPGLTIDAVTGVVTWDTRTAVLGALYALQVKISDDRGAFVTVDVVMLTVANVGSAPQCLIDGATGPASYAVTAGMPLSFAFTGSDADPDPGTGLPNGIVTLSSGALPPGSSTTPSLPTSGRSPLTSVFSWTPTGAQAGTWVLSFATTDNTGRQCVNAATVTVTDPPPTITCPAPIVVEATSAAGAFASVVVTVQDPGADPLSVEWEVDGALVRTDAVPGSPAPTPVSFTASFSLGAHAVTARVSDPRHPPAACSTDVAVVDTQPPALSGLPGDLTEEATGPGGAAVLWSPPTAFDVVDGVVPVVCVPPAGSTFPIGTTTVTCTATDSSGNSSTGSFDVTVLPSAQLQFFTATSTDGQNLLEWVTPAGGPYYQTVIRYQKAPTGTSSCAFPTATTGTALLGIPPLVPDARQSFLHTGLENDTAYCYAAFVQRSPAAPVFSRAREVKARPFDNLSGPVLWAFSAGEAIVVPPGFGGATVNAVTQGGTIHALVAGVGGGSWALAPWLPQRVDGPTQGRLSTIDVPTPVDGASRLMLVGSQNGSFYLIDASDGRIIWRTVLPEPAPVAPIQAGPNAWFTFFGATRNLVVISTRNGTPGARNRIYALELETGAIAWSYDGSADGRAIGIVNGMGSIDTTSGRFYVSSYAYGTGPGEQDTVWALDVDTGARLWSTPVGDVANSTTTRGGRVYLSSTDGLVHALDANDGSVIWSFDTGDGSVRGFLFPDRSSPTGRLHLSTTNRVIALDDLGTSPSVIWVRDGSAASPEPPAERIPRPSQVGGPSGTGWVYAGSSDGRLYRLDTGDGSTQEAIPLGDPAAPVPVGAVTFDVRLRVLYAASIDGVVYAVKFP